MKGYGDDHETPDRAETEHAVETLAQLCARPWRSRGAPFGRL